MEFQHLYPPHVLSMHHIYTIHRHNYIYTAYIIVYRAVYVCIPLHMLSPTERSAGAAELSCLVLEVDIRERDVHSMWLIHIYLYKTLLNLLFKPRRQTTVRKLAISEHTCAVRVKVKGRYVKTFMG